MNGRTFLVAVFAAMMMTAFFAGCAGGPQNARGGDFVWEPVGDGARITGYTGRTTGLRIPEQIEGMPVTEIGENAFSVGSAGREVRLTSVEIPASVTTIGPGAFRGNELTIVTIPDGVMFLGVNSFRNNQLSSVTIPDSVTSIEANAFAGNRFATVTVPDIATVNSQAFDSRVRVTRRTTEAGRVAQAALAEEEWQRLWRGRHQALDLSSSLLPATQAAQPPVWPLRSLEPLWFRVQVPESGRMNITTGGIVLQVHSYDGQRITVNGTASTRWIDAVAGETYFIRVGPRRDDTGHLLEFLLPNVSMPEIVQRTRQAAMQTVNQAFQDMIADYNRQMAQLNQAEQNRLAGISRQAGNSTGGLQNTSWVASGIRIDFGNGDFLMQAGGTPQRGTFRVSGGTVVFTVNDNLTMGTVIGNTLTLRTLVPHSLQFIETDDLVIRTNNPASALFPEWHTLVEQASGVGRWDVNVNWRVAMGRGRAGGWEALAARMPPPQAQVRLRWDETVFNRVN